MPEMLAFHNLLNACMNLLSKYSTYVSTNAASAASFLTWFVYNQGSTLKLEPGTALRLSACLFVRLLLPTDSAYASRRTPSAVVK